MNIFVLLAVAAVGGLLTEAKKQWGTNENVKNYIESDPLNGVEFVAVQTADKDGPEKYISG